MLLQQKIIINASRNELEKENERLKIRVPILQDERPEIVNVLADGTLVEDSFCHYDAQNNQLNIEINQNVRVYKIIY